MDRGGTSYYRMGDRGGSSGHDLMSGTGTEEAAMGYANSLGQNVGS